MTTFSNPKLSDRIRPDVDAATWVVEGIENLERQLDAAREEAAHVKEVEFTRRVAVVAENWRKKPEERDAEIAELRQQVTLLRNALTDTVAALEHRWEVIANRAAPIMESVIDAAHTKGVEALAATEPKP